MLATPKPLPPRWSRPPTSYFAALLLKSGPIIQSAVLKGPLKLVPLVLQLWTVPPVLLVVRCTTVIYLVTFLRSLSLQSRWFRRTVVLSVVPVLLHTGPLRQVLSVLILPRKFVCTRLGLASASLRCIPL